MTIFDPHYRGIGIIHGSFHEGLLSLYDTYLSFNPKSLWHFDQINLVSEQAVDDGTFHNDLVITGANAPSQTLGPNDGLYPLFGDGRRTGNFNSYAVSQNQDYGNIFTTGMTMICVYMRGDDGGGDLMVKKRNNSTSSAEGVSINTFGAVTARAGFQLAAQRANEVAQIEEYQWQLLEVYFPPGSAIPLLYRNGDQITGSNLTTNNFGPRGDYGAGLVIVGGQATSGSADAYGYYAMAGIYDRALTSAERAAYKNAAIAEGWFDDRNLERLFLPFNLSLGMLSDREYDQVIVQTFGTGWYDGTNYGDGEVGLSGFSGHRGYFQMNIGAGWVHYEPAGGPYNSNNYQQTYYYHIDAGGAGGPNKIGFRMGDPTGDWSDNSGTMEIIIYPQ